MKQHLGLGFGLVLAVGLTLSSVVGCSDTVDEITNSIDCHTVCERYADCFDADYDVEAQHFVAGSEHQPHSSPPKLLQNAIAPLH